MQRDKKTTYSENNYGNYLLFQRIEMRDAVVYWKNNLSVDQ